ncbi:hypothetical protein [Paralimibaculum aggregatum]|uniref:hypothetical protein n=1 Tax=Paralimibaculum aggregatum TaxID=3036245 RepID=UPI0025553B49|nr:hypothetical protein [Limibaculum sp. NKW23]
MAQLERTLSSEEFQASKRRRDFLRFIVEETLAGRGSRLKGYTIAVEAFDRDDSFDPQTDPVVRLEARRLRRDLDGYYVSAGRNDAVLISMPKGSYVPRFEWQEGNQPSGAGSADDGPEVAEDAGSPATPPLPSLATDPHRFARSGKLSASLRWGAIGLVGLLLLVAIAISLDHLRQSEDQATGEVRIPSVLIAAFHSVDGSETSHILADGITNELVSNLLRFPGFRLFLSSPVNDERYAANLNRLLAEEVAYLVTGEIVADSGRIRLNVHLSDVASGRVIWSETFARDLTIMGLVKLQADLAGEVASALGQPYGVVRNDILARGAVHVPAQLESYYCVLKAYQQRRALETSERGGVRICLEATARHDPAYAEAWAMLSWLELDEARFPAATPDAAEFAYERAFTAASKAAALEPDNVQALKALSAINHYRGNYEEGWRLARLALEKNPHDPDTLAQLGWRLAIRGRFEEGTPLLRRALQRTISPPGWYYYLIAVDHMMRGEYAEMLATAQMSAVGGGPVAYALVAVAAANLGKPAAARAALMQMESASSAFAADPAANYRIHGATDEIVARIMHGLVLAGWRQPVAAPKN